MDHAAAHETLADLALEPHRLERLETERAPATAELRAHVAGCADCAAELEAWRRVYGALGAAIGPGTGATLRSLNEGSAPSVPPALRERTLRAIRPEALDRGSVTAEPSRRTGAGTESAPRPRARRPLVRLAWLAAAAAVVVAVGTGGLAYQRSTEADQAKADVVQLGTATATLDRILAAPTHWVVPLRTADGAAGGTLAWSEDEVVVLASSLPVPAEGTTYRCWIERAGTRTPVGEMSFAGGVGYWAGSTAGWGVLESGSRFGVSAVSGPGTAGGQAVLVAEL